MNAINTNNILCIRVRTHKGNPLTDFQIEAISKKYSIDHFFLTDLVNNQRYKSYCESTGYLKVWLLKTKFGHELIAFTEFVVSKNCPKELYLYERDIIKFCDDYRDIIEKSMNFDINTIKPIDFPSFTKEKVLTPEKIENKINSILDKINAKVKKTGMSVNEAKESLSENEKLFLKSLQEK